MTSTTMGPSQRRSRFLSRRRIQLFLLGLFLLAAVVGPFVVPYDPIKPDPFNIFAPPSWAHPFGTDNLGLDVFSRLIVATRVDFSLALSGVLIGGGIGAFLGAWGALRRDWTDTALQRFAESVQAFPVLLFGIAIFAALGEGWVVLIIAIALVNIPLYLRQVRSVLLPLASAPFVQAARCSGMGNISIVLKHMLPNARGQIAALFALTCGYAVQIIAGLSFIGLGIEPPHPEWGSMINQGATEIIQGVWWPSVFPGAAIALTVYSLGAFTWGQEETFGRGGAI